MLVDGLWKLPPPPRFAFPAETGVQESKIPELALCKTSSYNGATFTAAQD
jgi:hypothetical protein